MDRRVVNSNRNISPYFQRFLTKFDQRLNRQMSVIDIGAGRYRHSQCLRALGMRNITCIDLFSFPDLLPKGVKFIEHDLEQGLPMLSEAHYDLLVCTFVLEFIQNRETVLAEIDRIAKDQAYLILEAMNKPVAQGYPINIEDVVDYFVRLGTWCVRDRLRGAGKKGYVLQKVELEQGGEPIVALDRYSSVS